MIKGTVSYMSDHSVKVIASGENRNLKEFIKFCNKSNIDSYVEKVELLQIPRKEFLSFEVV